MHPAGPIGLALITSLNTTWLAWMHVRESRRFASGSFLSNL